MELFAKAMALIPYIVAVNVVLSAVGVALQGISDATGKGQSSVAAMISKITAGLKKVLDLLAANTKH